MHLRSVDPGVQENLVVSILLVVVLVAVGLGHLGSLLRGLQSGGHLGSVEPGLHVNIVVGAGLVVVSILLGVVRGG
jgi:hypothetical protein